MHPTRQTLSNVLLKHCQILQDIYIYTDFRKAGESTRATRYAVTFPPWSATYSLDLLTMVSTLEGFLPQNHESENYQPDAEKRPRLGLLNHPRTRAYYRAERALACLLIRTSQPRNEPRLMLRRADFNFGERSSWLPLTARHPSPAFSRVASCLDRRLSWVAWIVFASEKKKKKERLSVISRYL